MTGLILVPTSESEHPVRERRNEDMKGTWRLPPNYESIRIVEGETPHRYRISFNGPDHLVLVNWDTGNTGLLSGTTFDVTAKWIEIAPNGPARPHELSGEYEALHRCLLEKD
jgi:hypothetical protein